MGRPKKAHPKDAYISRLTDNVLIPLLFPNGVLYYERNFSVASQMRCVWDALFPPPFWEPWKPPKRQGPYLSQMDAAISKIISDKEERLRLEEQGCHCPFYETRWSVANAALRTSMWFNAKAQQDALSKGRSELYEQSADHLTHILAQLLDARALGNFRGPIGYLETQSLTSQSWRADYEADLRQVKAIADAADALRRRAAFEATLQNAEAHNWRSFFIQRLGYIWRWLTGGDPPRSSGNNFFDFVEAIFACLDFGAPIGIDDAVKRVRGAKDGQGLPEWAQFDAFEKWGEAIAKERKERFRHALRLREISEGEFKLDAEENLIQLYKFAAPKEQREFRELGYAPPTEAPPGVFGPTRRDRICTFLYLLDRSRKAVPRSASFYKIEEDLRRRYLAEAEAEKDVPDEARVITLTAEFEAAGYDPQRAAR